MISLNISSFTKPTAGRKMKLSLKNTLKKFQKNDYDSILNLINNTLTFNHN